ncbi:aminoacyltransferase [Heyndrickxia oleronia]|uniref:lipid II:glycine glycyltransferase FemX n=1 Tax=Heyndrickxia oleronia TaxID=38875 RepID=UPI00090413E1|nr:GNAT family N-acetyltransferase [Heyndrickxia oleronia]MCM3453734.1 aminoacyltransferase [Heyndrickxia oleronia]OJH19395.1 hypothetical protein BLX88_09435 [Bacillus obstructivus]
MYEVISHCNKSKWQDKLNQFIKKDIYYNHSFSTLYKNIENGDPYLFYFENEHGKKICYVFFKRKLNILPFKNNTSTCKLYDITTPPFGYGGPLFDREDADLVNQFRKAFNQYCLEENIISEFIKFHPLLQNHRYMENLMEISYDRETIFIDLTIPEKRIFEQYHKNHKRNIKKAIKNQLIFKVFKNEKMYDQLHEFTKLYKETMDKVNASQKSYYSMDYFKKLIRGFTNKAIIGAVFHEEKMISAAICMYEGTTLHYHLGCSDKQFLNLGSNTFLFHNLSLWGRSNGLDAFYLGGGHSALHNGGTIERDSLFQFKYRFNQHGVLKFYIGRKIHNPIQYELLVNQWENYYSEKPNPNFFPLYRNKCNVYNSSNHTKLG